MAFLIIMLLLVGGTAIYLRAFPLAPRDLPLLAFSFSLVFFLSRFNGLATVWLGPYPLVGIHLYLMAVLVCGGLVLALGGRPVRRLVALPLPYLLLFVFLSILSGLINAGLDGVLAATQVMVISVVPALLAWVLVEWGHQNGQTTATMRRALILPLGVVTPAILVVSALMPDMFATLLGWGVSADFGGFEGFTRGWSPLGSTIDTGCLVVIVFGFALHESVAGRSKMHMLVAALCASSILFTASRSVMIMFLLYNLVYWILIRRWRALWRAATLPALAMLFILGWSLATGAVSFKRFVVTADSSTSRRAASAEAAVDLARERILIGHGPGQVYSEIRTTWLANPHHIPRVMEKKIGLRVSAMEPHNLYLYLLAEHGVFGALAFVAAMYVGLGVLWRLPVGGDESLRSGRAMSIGLYVGLAAVFASGSWPLLAPKYATFFWLFVFFGLDLVSDARRKAAT